MHIDDFMWIGVKIVYSSVNATFNDICDSLSFAIPYLRSILYQQTTRIFAYSLCLSMWLKYRSERPKSSFGSIASAVVWYSNGRGETQTRCVVSNYLLSLLIFFVITLIHKTSQVVSSRIAMLITSFTVILDCWIVKMGSAHPSETSAAVY
jgi:hypothetical protein